MLLLFHCSTTQFDVTSSLPFLWQTTHKLQLKCICMGMLFGILIITSIQPVKFVVNNMPRSMLMHMHFNCSLCVVCYREGIELVTSNWVVLQWDITLQNKTKIPFTWHEVWLGQWHFSTERQRLDCHVRKEVCVCQQVQYPGSSSGNPALSSHGEYPTPQPQQLPLGCLKSWRSQLLMCHLIWKYQGK